MNLPVQKEIELGPGRATSGGTSVVWRLLALLSCMVAGGCRLAEKAADVPGVSALALMPGKQNKSLDPVDLQQKVLRFTDEFFTRVTLDIGKLRRGPNSLDAAESLELKIGLGTVTCSIASGPNTVANLLDLTVFVTALRMALDEATPLQEFGESAEPLRESCRAAEKDIWRFAGQILEPGQQSELREAIEAWHRKSPTVRSVFTVRAVGFASNVAAEGKADSAKTGSVFGLLKLDPLSGLDPATREIAQTRLFAERALFVAQKMPLLIRWQTTKLTAEAAETPALSQLITNSTQITVAVERFSQVAERLPHQISAERAEIVRALEEQETKLRPLMTEVRDTLTAGSQMSASLTTTLVTFDALMRRFGVGETNLATAPQTNTEPFRIQDYGRTAEQLGATAVRLTELLVALDRTIGSTNLGRLSQHIQPAVMQASTSGKDVVDYAFWKGVLLVAIAFVAALVYRRLSARLIQSSLSKPGSE